MIEQPAPRPCGSCPYRCDVPSGVWDEDEYAKLPQFDGATGEQPPSVFVCHQQDGRICAGWAAVHDMRESLGLRIALSSQLLTIETYDATLAYSTDVALFASGAAAAAHGRAEIETPDEPARRVIEKLSKRKR